MRLGAIFATAAATAGLAAAPAAAHDVPADVTVQAFVVPEGPRLRLLVRVPMSALRDVPFPTRGPGYLDLPRADASLREATRLWLADAIELYEGDVALPSPQIAAVRVSLPSDPSFGSYEDALTHVTGPPLPDDTEIPWGQAMLDVAFEYPIRSEASRFSIHPGFGRLGLRVVTVLRFRAPGGAVRAFELEGDPGLVRLDPRRYQAASRFVALGVRHILDGTDHLLFLLCLVIPLRRRRRLVLVVTAFTVAHSITLIAAAFGLGPDGLWFPPLVEMLIAVSIVYMALENILVPQPRRRWMMAFGFGLVHGFGFSFALRRTLQFAGSHLLTSLLSFNVGIELGQLLVLVALVPALALLFRRVPERTGAIVLSALVAHTGWHWMLERWDRLRPFRVPRPRLDAALLASATGWLIVVVVAAGLAWLGWRVFGAGDRPRVAKEAE
jgi:hypothetical protein